MSSPQAQSLSQDRIAREALLRNARFRQYHAKLTVVPGGTRAQLPRRQEHDFEAKPMTAEEDRFFQTYPELHHYTRWGALQAIFTTNTLRGTHYKYLNDLTEIEHMTPPKTGVSAMPA